MTLIEKHNSLMVERMKMDRFFTMFLDKFDRKMDPEKPDTPIWKLYKQKSKEYSELNGVIITADVYINKLKNV